MPNPAIFQNNNINQNNYLQQLWNTYKMAKNPQQFLQQNNQIKQIMQMSNGNPKQLFLDLCK